MFFSASHNRYEAATGRCERVPHWRHLMPAWLPHSHSARHSHYSRLAPLVIAPSFDPLEHLHDLVRHYNIYSCPYRWRSRYLSSSLRETKPHHHRSSKGASSRSRSRNSSRYSCCKDGSSCESGFDHERPELIGKGASVMSPPSVKLELPKVRQECS